MQPLPGNMQGANFPAVKFFLLTSSRPSAIIPKVKGGSIMKQEAFTMSLLFDTYGALLTEKQQTYFDLYYNQDLSLAEIAEQEGISRQGVHDAISRSEALLAAFERVTGMPSPRSPPRPSPCCRPGIPPPGRAPSASLPPLIP